MFVSLLTITCGYPKAVLALLIWDTVTLFTEFWWIQVVWNHFPALHVGRKHQSNNQPLEDDHSAEVREAPGQNNVLGDWGELAAMPIFYGTC